MVIDICVRVPCGGIYKQRSGWCVGVWMFVSSNNIR